LIDTTTKIYNFEVEENHNYFVGKQQILVHNDCNSFLTALKAKRYAKLEKAFLGLDDAARAKFLADFETKGDDFLKALNDEDLVSAWRNNLDNPNRVDKDWLRSYKQADDLIANPTNINSLSKPPQGYEFYVVGGEKKIRRINAKTGLKQLTVDAESGNIVEFTGSARISKSGKLRAALGTAPTNHEAHHLVPDNVVRGSPLHRYAIEQGWYDVDRAANGKFLARTDLDKVTGVSDMFPTHSGSHGTYDTKIKNKISDVLNSNGINDIDIPSLNENQVKNLIGLIESESEKILIAWVGKLN
jgi:hypothetical protein